MAARVAATVVRIPPASYGAAGHARRELVGTIAGEHEVAVTVDEAGHHAPTGGVDSLIGGRRLTGADRFDEPVDQHDPCVAQLAGGADLELGVVGDQPADVVDRRSTGRS